MKCLAVACVLLSLAPVAQAQSAAVPVTRLRAQLPPAIADSVFAVLAQADAIGLPTRPLAERALEALAKNQPAESLPGMLEQFSADMIAGRAALEDAGVGNPDADEIEAAATALARGVSGDEIAETARAQHGGALTVPLFTLAELRDRGLPSDQAIARALTRVQAVANGADPGANPGRPAVVPANPHGQGHGRDHRPTPPGKGRPD
ncbi:MAG TPA: hypothetical protein VFL95_03775 [Gemmatimonadales bacterium]|jgi:hypothetical protein|nr:hypothetical protein [Gemmatimonadales bacterium]